MRLLFEGGFYWRLYGICHGSGSPRDSYFLATVESYHHLPKIFQSGPGLKTQTIW